MNVEIIRSWTGLPWSWLGNYSTYYLTQPYIENWLEYFSDGQFAAVSVSDSEGIKALFPIVEGKEKILGKDVRLWRCVGWNSGAYPLSFLPCNAETAGRFLSYLSPRAGDWDGVLVSCTPDILPEIEAEALRLGFGVVNQSKQVIPFISIEKSWDEYYRSLSKKLQQDIRRLFNKAKRTGDLQYRKVTQQIECERIINIFVDMHEQRWGQKGEISKYATKQKHRDFLKSLVSSLLMKNKLLLTYLALNDKPIAIAVNILEKGKVYYAAPTFAVEYAELSPGKLLLYHIIREAFEIGCYEIDLGPGVAEYKCGWANGTREVDWRMIVGNNRRVRLKYQALPWVKRNMKKVAGCLPGGLAMIKNAQAVSRQVLGK
jgi:hypothetical protein